MKKKTIFNTGYYFDSVASDKSRNIHISSYSLEIYGDTTGDNIPIRFESGLSADVDIFNELPKYVYDNEDVRNFLSILRNALLTTNLDGTTLSKLRVSEHNSSGLVLDWIYNYFRVYFSFDSEDGNFYGIISSNPEQKSFSNDFRMMNPEQYESLAKSIVDYVITMIHA